MRELLYLLLIIWRIKHPEFSKQELDILPTEALIQDSKSGMSDKDGYSAKGELIEAPFIPNPLDRIELQLQPPTIINPPKVTNVDP